MAKSGSVTATIDSGHKTLRFDWEQIGHNLLKKESTIYWEMHLWADPDGSILPIPTKWEVYNKITGVFTSGYALITAGENTTKPIASGYIYAKHDDEGEGSLSLAFYSVEFGGGTVDVRLDPLPIPSTLIIGNGTPGMANGTLGVAQTLTINRRVTEGFTHKLTYRLAYSDSTLSYIIGSSSSGGTVTSTSWTPPISLAGYNPTGTKVELVLSLTTYYNGEQMGSAMENLISCDIPESLKPSLTLTVKDATDCLTKYGNYVQRLSQLSVELTPALAAGSGIVSYVTTADGYRYTAKRFTSEVLRTSGTVEVSATVTDGRGRTGTASKSLTVIPYNRPAIKTLKVGRCDYDGSANDKGAAIRVSFSASVTPLKDINSAKYLLMWKKSTEDSYTGMKDFPEYDEVYEVTNVEHIFPADTGSSYDIELWVTDNHYTSKRVTSASSAFTLMHWAADGTSIAFGKVAEEPNLFDVGLRARFNGPVHGRVLGLDNLPSIESNEDLNTYMTTGCYAIYSNATAETIDNIPLPYAGRLIVSASTGEGETVTKWSYIRQTFIPYDLKYPTYERDIVRDGTNVWTYRDWVQVRGGTQKVVLWSGRDTMTGTINLSDAVSRQLNGIVLVFARCDADNNPYDLQTFFVPKSDVKRSLENTPDIGRTFMLATSDFAVVGVKNLYIHDGQITGNDSNGTEGDGASGIHYNNGAFELQAVLGV